MKAVMISLLIIVISNIKVEAINCYTCISTGNCISKNSECPEDDNACQKIVKGSVIEKRCSSISACIEEQRNCKNGTCQVFCCKDDYCNGSSRIDMDRALASLVMALLAWIVAVKMCLN